MTRAVRRRLRVDNKAWNGGSREAALLEANRRRDEALAVLRAAFVRSGAYDHPIGCTEPFTAADAPGWVYLPIEDTVILADTARRLKDLFA